MLATPPRTTLAEHAMKHPMTIWAPVVQLPVGRSGPFIVHLEALCRRLVSFRKYLHMRAFETNPLEVKVAYPMAIILRPSPGLTPMSKSAIQKVVTW
ncbi:hypothetical protein CN071_25090 [Sinorhizobium meliloti]|uniref:Uncharacterized protein n=2 Tax=Rhizobium meliloti TaxID=382 RepID=Q92VP3_RHIME|nr:hypothetical protein SM2011_b21077 [Sinorhizobium meliloti 2011]ASP62221.1 hypothetical protein CDO30_28970 [Sinorhizobium meliloti]CAC49056.1 putative protein [Sinorhizobium meliloti 1021]MDW9842936.1 hypothetical protein [Sinorhizobium meliloti]PTD29269.1 hypothetical protein C5N13_09340 [Sinorhizobium meliloti]